MTRYKLFRGMFLDTKGVLFLNKAFLWRNFKILYMIFRVILLQIHFGSAAARIRNDFFGSCLKFRIRPDPDPQHCHVYVKHIASYGKTLALLPSLRKVPYIIFSSCVEILEFTNLYFFLYTFRCWVSLLYVHIDLHK